MPDWTRGPAKFAAGVVLAILTLGGAALGVMRTAGPALTAGESGRLCINTATAAELDALPGIGPTLAERIVRWREKHGGFERVEDLARVEGIGARKLERLRGVVRISRKAEER
ncbi:MAG: helix-hairpin-helix domain-containing protein [Phycisphaerales bacterium]|nr:helix-hairpin-helix domain-containing protein [Phycisphaerales bacterium]